MVGDHFGHKFICRITKTNLVEVIHPVRFWLFGNESYEGMIERRGNSVTILNSKNSYENITFNDILELAKEGLNGV